MTGVSSCFTNEVASSWTLATEYRVIKGLENITLPLCITSISEKLFPQLGITWNN